MSICEWLWIRIGVKTIFVDACEYFTETQNFCVAVEEPPVGLGVFCAGIAPDGVDLGLLLGFESGGRVVDPVLDMRMISRGVLAFLGHVQEMDQ